MKGYKFWMITWQRVQKLLKQGLDPKTSEIKISNGFFF